MNINWLFDTHRNTIDHFLVGSTILLDQFAHSLVFDGFVFSDALCEYFASEFFKLFFVHLLRTLDVCLQLKR